MNENQDKKKGVFDRRPFGIPKRYIFCVVWCSEFSHGHTPFIVQKSDSMVYVQPAGHVKGRPAIT